MFSPRPRLVINYDLEASEIVIPSRTMPIESQSTNAAERKSRRDFLAERGNKLCDFCKDSVCSRGVICLLSSICIIIIIGLLAELRAWLARDRYAAAVSTEAPDLAPSSPLWEG
jgi:hypothetical protein